MTSRQRRAAALRKSARRLSAVLLLATALAASCGAAVAPGIAQAAKHPGPRTAVEMGDSYMAGVGGRYFGNSRETTGSRGGTDRECSPSMENCEKYEESKVFEGPGCGKSDVAQIRSSVLRGIEARANLACNGAETKNVRLSSDGGEGQNNEPPQADQLLALAKTHDVKFIVLMIGGNDLTFEGVLISCVGAYEAHAGPCHFAAETAFLNETKIKEVTARVSAAVNDVKSAMSQDGYAENEYRLVLETYPVVVASASELRYPEWPASEERKAAGCPLYDADLEWVYGTGISKFNTPLITVAAEDHLPLLEDRHALEGHGICGIHDSEASLSNLPTPTTMEWGMAWGAPGEVWHPDAYGQMAMGNCLGRMYGKVKLGVKVPYNYSCSSRPGRTPQEQIMSKLGLP